MRTDPITGQVVEEERYELQQGPAYRFQADRREFVQVLGAGLVVAVTVRTAQAQQRRGRQARQSESLAERFHFGTDGVVTVLTSKVEVGQGSRTQIAQAAAEELQVPMEQIRVVMADTERCPDDGGTAGSRTTPSTVPRVRTAAAAARQWLTRRAAERLAVDPSAVQVERGEFVHGPSGRRLSLAELVQEEGFAERLDQPLPEEVAVRRVDQWTVLGTSAEKVTGRDVVTGQARYPSDIVRDNMRYGKVLRPPAYGATLQSIDTAAAAALPGVTVVRDGEFVGCTAASSWMATKAVEMLADGARWETPQQVSSDVLFDHLKRTAQPSRRSRDDVWGEGAGPLASAATPFRESYTVAYIQHAPMEPRAAVAEWTGGHLTVWTGSQQPSRVRGELAEVFRIPEERVRVIVPDTGGGFGGKHTGEVAVEAARLAKAAGRPVSLRWTRQEEFTWAYFRPAGLIEVQAGLDDSGKLLVWDFTNYNSGGSAIQTPYQVPHGRTRFLSSDAPLRQGSYRALASTANTFAREIAMDELAAKAGRDPLEFRLSHLEDGRLRNVLVAAAERFGWSHRRQQPRGAGRGIGLACGTEKGSFTAACAEVEVAEGTIHLRHICQAFECGAIQNPRNLQSQVEGSIVMGLGGALFEEIRFRDGRITNASFSQYRVPRIDDLPEMDIVLVNRTDLPSVGAGETPIIAVAPAMANAVYDAVKQRLRSMPLKLEAV
jgi:isoquinoline 1-oxidoreductase